MKYWKHLVLSTALVVVACDGEDPPDPVLPDVSGTVSGTVTVDGVGMAGITATISSGGNATTDNTGNFSLTGVPEGNHTVTLSGFEDDVQFSATAQSVSITRQSPSASVTFAGAYIRTSTIFGAVTVEGGNVLSGVTVQITGGPESISATETSDAQGQYSFTGLRRGMYTVSISGFNTTRYGFPVTNREVTVGLGETRVANFEGEFTAHARISGQVKYEVWPAPGVTVSLSGGLSTPAPVTTDADGAYSFPSLKPGTYTVSIGGYAGDVRFAVTAQTYTVEDHQVNAATFEGMFDRTGSISGSVHIGDMLVRGAEVKLSGTFDHGVEDDEISVSNAVGEFEFDGLRQGSYTVMVADLPDADMDFDGRDELSVMLAMGESSSGNNFEGHDGSISGMVSVEGGLPLKDVEVSLSSDHRERTAMTDAGGMYSFGYLRAGDYTITIAGYDDAAFEFSSTSAVVSVADGGSSSANFEGMYEAQASISGHVMYEAWGAPGVTVTLSGGLTSAEPVTTDAEGAYSFSSLKPGTYTVAISGYDADVTFGATSQSYMLDGETITAAAFEGMFDRTGSISGAVHVGDMLVRGAEVKLSGTFDHGVEDDEISVSNAVGEFEFDGLRQGSYTVMVVDLPDADMDFDGRDELSVMLAMGEGSSGNNFGGHDGSISGMVSVEGGLPLKDVEVSLSSDHRERTAMTNAGGMYSFGNLRAGDYTITITGYDDVAYEFSSTSSMVSVADGGSSSADFEGMYEAQASISGHVMYEAWGAPGVTVTLSGGLTSAEPATTDAMGAYAFPSLKPGTYTVTISGYDADVTFGVTSHIHTVDDEAVVAVAFEGMFDRTASIAGSVFVGSTSVLGAEVKLSGTFDHGSESDMMMTTDKQGAYEFTKLRKGSYMLTVVSLPDEDMDFHGRDEASVMLDMGAASKNNDFAGHDGSISGMVSVEGLGPLAGVSVSLASDHRERTAETDAGGMYSFGNLRAGDYTVTVGDYDDDSYEFATSSVMVAVTDGGAMSADFEGMYEALATISGTVTYEGVPASGVTVTASGGLTDAPPATTDEAGVYSIAGLQPSTYTVAVSGHPADVTFPDASQVTLTLDNPSSGVDYNGTIARDQTLSGTVFVDGVARPGVEVTAKASFDYGPASYTMSLGTTQGGTYEFTALRAGDYTVTITASPEELGYDFTGGDAVTVSLAAGAGGNDVDFNGTQKMEAHISGHLFLDEDGEDDRMRNAETEDNLTVADVAVMLERLGRASSGEPEVWTTVDTIATDSDGYYEFANLPSGEYRVTLAVTDPALPGNVALKSAATLDRSLWWNGKWVNDYPFRITQQRVDQQVMIGAYPVAGWSVCLYDTQANASANLAATANTSACAAKGMIASTKTDNLGVAKLRFDRSDDTNPGAVKGSDMVAFVYAHYDHTADTAYHDVRVENDPARVTEVTWARKDSIGASPLTVPLRYDNVYVAATIQSPVGPLAGWNAQFTSDASGKAADHTGTSDKTGLLLAVDGDNTLVATVGNTVTFRVTPDSANSLNQTGNDSVGLPDAVENPFTVKYGAVHTDAKADAKAGIVTYTPTGLVPPMKPGTPATVSVATATVSFTAVDVVVPAHRELDEMPGFNPKNGDLAFDGTGAGVSVPALDITLVGKGAPAALQKRAHVSFDNVPVGSYTVAATAAMDGTSGAVPVKLVSADSFDIELVGGAQVMATIEYVSVANTAAGTEASAFAYKRTDGTISGNVMTTAVDQNVGDVEVILASADGMTHDTTTTADTTGFYEFEDLVDGTYSIMIPVDTFSGANTADPAGKDNGIWLADELRTNDYSGDTWVLTAGTWVRDTLPNTDASTAVRVLANPEDPGGAKAAATVVSANFLAYRQDTEIRGQIYNDRQPPPKDELGNVITQAQGLGGAAVNIYESSGGKKGPLVQTHYDRAGDGTYSVRNLPEGTYIVEPVHAGAIIAPKTRTVTTDPTVAGHEIKPGTTLPSWNYEEGTAATTADGLADFAYINAANNSLTVTTTASVGDSTFYLEGARVRLAQCILAVKGPNVDESGTTYDGTCSSYKQTADNLTQLRTPTVNGARHVFTSLDEGVYEIRATHDHYDNSNTVRAVVIKGQTNQEATAQVKFNSR